VYEKKEEFYFDSIRKDLLELIPETNRGGVLLEIGAGKGNTLHFAKTHHYASEVHGIELCKIDNSFQKNDQLDSFTIGDIETMDIDFDSGRFDVILCGDVLEHLKEPHSVLKRLSPLLRPNGVIIASIPNIREVNTLKSIVFQGDFKYTDTGILDRTHLRFFCKKNIVELFTDNGYDLLQIGDLNWQRAKSWKFRFFEFLTMKKFEDFFITQYYVVTKKNDPIK
jgi:2-polyprenyl-3-methyl-5-hydroxy-6-metoxy-1,4-benzoquinol methylase